MSTSNKSKINVQTFIIPKSSLTKSNVNEYNLYAKLSDAGIKSKLPKNAMIFSELQDHYQLFITGDDGSIKPVKYITSDNLTSLRQNLKDESDKIFTSLKSTLTNDMSIKFSELRTFSESFNKDLSSAEAKIETVFENLETRLADLTGYEGSSVQMQADLNELKRKITTLSEATTTANVYTDNKIYEVQTLISDSINTCNGNILDNASRISSVNYDLQALRSVVDQFTYTLADIQEDINELNAGIGNSGNNDDTSTVIMQKIKLSDLSQDVLNYITYHKSGETEIKILPRQMNTTLQLYDDATAQKITYYISSTVVVGINSQIKITNSQTNWNAIDKSTFKFITLLSGYYDNYTTLSSTSPGVYVNLTNAAQNIAIAWPQDMNYLPGSSVTVEISTPSKTLSVADMISTLEVENKLLKANSNNMENNINLIQSNYDQLKQSYTYLSEKVDRIMEYLRL